jgi:hypothetical protein
MARSVRSDPMVPLACLAINLLYPAGPLYMLQVYIRFGAGNATSGCFRIFRRAGRLRDFPAGRTE